MNQFEDPKWLRAVLTSLVQQLGGKVDIDLRPALRSIEGIPEGVDKELGEIRYEYLTEPHPTIRLTTLSLDAPEGSAN